MTHLFGDLVLHLNRSRNQPHPPIRSRPWVRFPKRIAVHRSLSSQAVTQASRAIFSAWAGSRLSAVSPALW